MDKTFTASLTISLLLHSLLLWGVPHFPSSIFRPEKKQADLELVYYELKDIMVPSVPEQESKALDTSKIKDEVKPKELPKEPEKEIKEEKKSPIKKVELTDKPQPEKIDLPKGPIYLDYCEAIRERIKRVAYENYPTQFFEGEVDVAFIISRDGYLKKVNVLAERPFHNKFLRQAALRSVELASPFPPFPRGLRQKEVNFNVTISFESSR